MKRTLALAALLAPGLVLLAQAQAPAPAGPPAKVAVIAFQMAVAQTNEGQTSFAALEKKYEPRQAAIKTLSDQVDSMTKQLQAQGATLSDADKAARAKAIDDKKKQLDREYQAARTDFQQDMSQVYNGLAVKVLDVMTAYAQQQGYTLVLDVSEQQSPVLYFGDAANITKAVIEAYNAKSGVPAPAPAPASGAGASGVPDAPMPSAPQPAH